MAMQELTEKQCSAVNSSGMKPLGTVLTSVHLLPSQVSVNTSMCGPPVTVLLIDVPTVTQLLTATQEIVSS
jgi:hypothetical protein